MEPFTWYKKYSVNNEELDKHHKELFKIFNRLYQNCLNEDGKSTLGPIVAELVSYAGYHFNAEEQHMRDIGYKGIENHRREHELFTERIVQLQQRENVNDIVLSKELIVYLGNWLLNHVIGEDKKFSV